MLKDSSGVRICVAEPSLRLPALLLVHQNEPDSVARQQSQEFLRTAEFDARLIENLLVATRGNELVGAGWAMSLPGKVAVLRPPRLTSGEPESTSRLLLRHLEERAAQDGVLLVQSLLDAAGDEIARQRLQAAGYGWAADLSYLAGSSNSEPSGTPPFELLGYRGGEEERLGDLLEATYVDTLDVPSLNGVRSIEDVIAGYQQSGDYRAENWFLVQKDGKDAGCLLLTEYRSQGYVELVYMGLVPGVRGRGWGMFLIEQAKAVTHRLGHDRFILAVDSRNTPAVEAYQRAGCTQFDQRAVFLKTLVPAP